MSHHTTENQASNTFGLVMIAALAGAAAALLLAPKKGTDMRDELKGRLNDMKVRSHETNSNAQSKIADTAEAASRKVKDMADKSKEVADQTSQRARNSKKNTDNNLMADENDVFGDQTRPKL